jgi:peptide/nickel transport system substrate-binding protein
MHPRPRSWIAAMTLSLALVAAACSNPSGPGPAGGTGDERAERGGIAIWESEEFGFTNAFDPTGEYLGEAHGIYSNMLIRTLVSTKHLAGAAGNELVPDLAEEMPEVSDDGLTYTFTIKDGVKFGPPLSREITSADVEYAFRRIATRSLVAQYANYYVGTIEGMEIGKDPGPGGIEGIETPDDKTIVFHLTEPTGDFLYRLAMPAAGPIPEEVAGCFKRAGEYGRFVISSSSYMLEGSEDLDASSCRSMEPISGFDPTRELSLVRNPDYDQSTDESRKNYIDGLRRPLNTNTNDLEQRVLADEADFIYTPTPGTLRRFVTDEELRPRLYSNAGDRTWYITMNLATPPFDDIHVRKAANLVMDKDGLRRAWGGPTQGEIAIHIIPDTMLEGALDDYDPYPTGPDHTGDEEAARAEMAQSKYDTDGDGECDADVCKNVLQVSSNTPPNADMIPAVEESLAKIGITLDIREVTDAYTPIQTVERAIPISIRPGWGKDYPDAYTFVGFLFDGRNIICTGNSNYSLIGLTPEKADECGIPYPEEGVPSIDEDIDECSPLTDDERLQCWVDLDKKLMEEIVPWVPYLDSTVVFGTSAAVTRYEFDQFTTTPAWSRIAVDESLQANR